MASRGLKGASFAILFALGVGAPAHFASAALSPKGDAASAPLSPTVQKLLEDAGNAIKVRNYDLALIQYKNAVRLAPQNGPIRTRLAALLLFTHQYVAAERELRQARNDGAP